jgi:hypothetical protein
MAHADAIELIKNGGMVVRLLLRRGNIAPPMGNLNHNNYNNNENFLNFHGR